MDIVETVEEHLYFRGEDYDALSLVHKAQEDLDVWIGHDDMEELEVNTIPVNRAEERWSPPPQNYLKCNTDAAIIGKEVFSFENNVPVLFSVMLFWIKSFIMVISQITP
ncbi:unnamed protein product [Eruca vesicaria subsp. sativa]|uniref:Uncharacterized protein n=1 Tax=Eruca vesicaria subsp. sativa TaxID=29727 RepID=A0ABC8L2I3_ERUVS|nr:unnamed protein product [Eruca vesicaria subsp. sativa]